MLKESRATCCRRGLKLAALKFNGLLSKIGQSRQLGTTEKIDVFVICETKLNDKVKDQLVDIDEFDLKRHDRSRHGGGFAMYVRNTINFKLRGDLPNKSL